MGEFVHDPRHRYSYELRPDPALDAALRQLAVDLEAEGLLPAGAATAPRFHPHLTLLRADRADADLLAELATRIAANPDVALDEVGSFGAGRIAWFGWRHDTHLQDARTWLIEALGGTDHVDPLALRREPWVPHLTVAYAIAEPHRDAARARLAAQLPLTGSWIVAHCWDLDVRPTRLVHEAIVARTS